MSHDTIFNNFIMHCTKQSFIYYIFVKLKTTTHKPTYDCSVKTFTVKFNNNNKEKTMHYEANTSAGAWTLCLKHFYNFILQYLNNDNTATYLNVG